jgi:hypothetical protein
VYDGARDPSEKKTRNLIDGCVEVVARMADAADRVAFAAADSDPRFGARTSGDILRQTPETARRAAYALNDGLIDVSESIVNLLDLRTWDCDRQMQFTAVGETRTGTAYPSRLQSETDIVNATRRFINSGRNRGTTLGTLLRHLGPQTSYTNDELKAVISRHFLVDGDLILPAGDNAAPKAAGLPDSIEAHLKALGYTEVRHDVPLERLGEGATPARMVAYEDGRPAILVYKVVSGRLSNPAVEEDARFEAEALSRSHKPRFIYLTDGTSNRYIDVALDRVIADLPHAGSPA